VAQFLANLWQGPWTAVHGMDAEPSSGALHSSLAPQVQCGPGTITGRAWSERRSFIRYGGAFAALALAVTMVFIRTGAPDARLQAPPVPLPGSEVGRLP
jgi:hypothetical protein